MGTEVQFCKSSGEDGGDGCTIVSMFLMPQTCTLNMVKIINYVMCILPF